MYQRVLRDPGGEDIVRVLASTEIVDGSILIVPADTVAFFVCNGLVSQVYAPGRYEVSTGVSPFFVRLRNLMTRGDAGITVQVFFVNVKREICMRGGTGDIVFKEKRFNISLKAMAAYTIRCVITEPLKFVQQLVGMYREEFYTEDILPAIESIMKPYVREKIARYLAQHQVHDFQNELVSMGNELRSELHSAFQSYGITLRDVVITAINISDSELARLRMLEEKYAGGIVQTDIEVDNINRVYGNVNTRTLTEAVTGSVRGPATSVGGNDASVVNNMASVMAVLPVQMALANQLASSMNGQMTDIVRQSNILSETRNGANHTTVYERGFSKESTQRPTFIPDLPERTTICGTCKVKIGANDKFCKHCGSKQ